MQKLSVQEFSYLTQELPSSYEKSRGHSAENVEDKDFFRRRNKYITLFNDKPNGVSHNNHSASLSDENNNIHQSSDSGSNSNEESMAMDESLNVNDQYYINDEDNGPLEAENVVTQDFSENSEDFQNSNPYYNHLLQSQILSQEEYTNQNRPELNENAYAYSDYTISNDNQDYLYNKKSRSFYPQRYTGYTNTDSDSGSNNYFRFRFRNNKSSSKLKTLKTTGSKLGKNLNHKNKNIIKLNPTRTNLKLLAGTTKLK